jgi:hypothetical protein
VALFPTRLASGGNIASAGFAGQAQYAVAPDGQFLMNVAAEDASSHGPDTRCESKANL